MRKMAGKGLLESIDDVWASVGSRFSNGVKEDSTGDDGRLYAIPYSHGPWAVFYLRSLFAERGYAVPTTWEEYLALADRMRLDGIAPMALADLEEFPALGIFDILNLRLNGYQFHVDLLAGRESWTDRRVRDVFDPFRQLLATAQPDPAGRPWADAATALAEKRAGMLYFATFVTYAVPDAVVPDLGMFAFPDLGTAFDAEKAVEDPADGFVAPRNAPNRAADLDNAKALLEYLTTPSVQYALATVSNGPASLPGVDLAQSAASSLQTQAAEIVGAARHATQFLDRDTSGPFAGLLGHQLKNFLIEPDQEIDAFLAQVQAAWNELT